METPIEIGLYLNSAFISDRNMFIIPRNFGKEVFIELQLPGILRNDKFVNFQSGDLLFEIDIENFSICIDNEFSLGDDNSKSLSSICYFLNKKYPGKSLKLKITANLDTELRYNTFKENTEKVNSIPFMKVVDKSVNDKPTIEFKELKKIENLKNLFKKINKGNVINSIELEILVLNLPQLLIPSISFKTRTADNLEKIKKLADDNRYTIIKTFGDDFMFLNTNFSDFIGSDMNIKFKNSSEEHIKAIESMKMNYKFLFEKNIAPELNKISSDIISNLEDVCKFDVFVIPYNYVEIIFKPPTNENIQSKLKILNEIYGILQKPFTIENQELMEKYTNCKKQLISNA